ncbi:hypothetical protein H7K14_00050 [Mycolicibacter longobardus]|uniref:hypothetical protein n=1 Tax=Mycolicibacter longobardus TaxID=1108812 RepID=UPI0021F31CD6|nr:hypothetical protein [Mycolicibacter longobardus]MCV7382220.1 hypothetical protein [Mycolicibacter longobardus]
MKFTPWALADIARVVLVTSNEFRQDATRDDLLHLADDYVAQDDPELGTGDPDALATFLLRATAEQVVYNQSRRHDLGRCVAVFEQTDPTKALQVLSDPGWVEDLLGCSLSQYVGIGFIVHTSAIKNGGRFLEDWLDTPDMEPITSEIPTQLIRDVIQNHFTGDLAWYQRERESFRPSAYRRFTYNPLISRPVVSGLTDERLVPVPGLVDRKISPLGLWYTGFDRWGKPFADDVGELFEQYVGRQLDLIPDAQVHPEIIFNNKQDRSVDWIVVCNSAVLLVEVKSARPTEAIRLGAGNVWAELGAKLAKAFQQIDKTSELISERNPEFRSIPDHLPRIGLIVTMEDFPSANYPDVRNKLNVSPSLPVCVCSSEELEILVTITDEAVDAFLWNFLADRLKAGHALTNEIRDPKHQHSRNKILDDAWNSYTWATPPVREQEEEGDFPVCGAST